MNFECVGLFLVMLIGLWGYFGGGLVSVWVVEVCGEYVLDLDIVGVVLGLFVGDFGYMFCWFNGIFFVGLFVLVVVVL